MEPRITLDTPVVVVPTRTQLSLQQEAQELVGPHIRVATDLEVVAVAAVALAELVRREALIQMVVLDYRAIFQVQRFSTVAAAVVLVMDLRQVSAVTVVAATVPTTEMTATPA
jgi:hypothetical protein